MGDIPSNSTYDFLAGHIGHLTKHQEDALKAFKENLLKANLYTIPDGAGAGSGKASHDDQTLLWVLNY
jgi:hypothetical protein